MTNALRRVEEKRVPVQGYAEGIPWSMHLRAYEGYCKEYSQQKALIEGWCRGGFSTGELDSYIPGWRDELSENSKLKKELGDLKAEREADKSDCRLCWWYKYQKCGRIDGVCIDRNLFTPTEPVHLISDRAMARQKGQ